MYTQPTQMHVVDFFGACQKDFQAERETHNAHPVEVVRLYESVVDILS